MNSEVIGKGEPEHAVIYHIHGDEPCGKRAVERFKDSDHELKKPLKLVFANEKAAEADERYTEADLNRSFPGDPESDLYEQRLASEILDEVGGLKILNIHSTRSQPTPFGILKDTEEESIERARSTGMKRLALFEEEAGSMEEYADSALIEAGPQGTDEAVEQAYQALLNFLGYHDVIDYEPDLKEPEIYRIIETVEGGDYKFLGTNFQLVEKGEKYAERNDEDVIADRDFYPVLMSTDGYTDMLGFKAERIQ